MKNSFMFHVMMAMFVVSSATVLCTSLYSRTVVGFLTSELESNIASRLKETARRGAVLVTVDELATYYEEEDMKLPSYQVLRHKLRDFSEESGILYVYYLRAENGMMQYIIDNDFDEATRVGLDTPPTGVADTPGLKEALGGRVTSPPLGSYMKGWEGLLSAYAPIFGPDGTVAAVCGVDINDESIVDARRREYLLRTLEIGAVAAVLVSAMFCLAAYRREARLADEANAEKSRFLASVGHEMRRPLTTISAHAQLVGALLKNGKEPVHGEEKIRAALCAVRDEADRLTRMSDAAVEMEMIRSELGSMREMELGGLLRTTCEICRILVERRGNRLTVDVSEELPLVIGNADSISQVLINLISNANEYTREGDIRVKAAGHPSFVSVTISDTGIGIKPEALRSIFQRHPLRDSGGEVGGMGLSICREIVERHGGTIQIDSEPAKGTTVSFKLPIGRDRK
jgi:signal transduction histidine kinase